MFKFITKLAAAVAILAVAFTASSAFAAFNDGAQGTDCQTVTVARTGNAPTTGYGCWYTSDTASDGDIVTFAVYYHNTASSPVSGVSVFIDNPGTISKSSFTLSGGIKINGSVVKTGSATIRLGQSSRLVLNKATNEYNGGANKQDISAADFMGSGYSIGTVGTGWSAQGVAKISFKVVADSVACPAGYTGTQPNCVPVQQYCPSGYTGVYPNCVPVQQYCPSGYTGIYPNCYPIQQYCPSGYYGTYPNCYPINQVCGVGYYGTYPNCYPITPTCNAGYYLQNNVCVPIQTNSAPSVSTLGTISIGGTVAVVDGYYSTNSCAVTTYFNYGRTQSLGQSTGQVNRGTGSGSMAQALPNLVPNTTYYYQAVGTNCAGTSYGDIRSFTTSNVTTNDTTITRYVTVTTGGGGNSFIKLMIDNHRDVVRNGRSVTYDIAWENLTNTTLRNLVLEINFPGQMTILDTDRGAIEAKKSAVIYQIATLSGREKGEMSVSGEIDSGMKDGDPVVAQAIMAFENPKTSATENAIAYDADTYSIGGTVLGASLFGIGFLPGSLAGWLLILLIILLIVLIVRHFWHPNQTNVTVQQPVTPVIPTAPAPAAGAQHADYIVYQPTPKQ